jgi:integrating conjugative element membrane protein (TIGR03747 family)
MQMIQAMRSRQLDQEANPRRAPGALARLLAVIGRIMRLLLLSLLVSVLVEWVGMAWWWPEQGVNHSRSMLQAEIDYLDSNMRQSLISRDPANFAQTVAESVYHSLFVRTKLVDTIEWLSATPPRAGPTRQRLSRLSRAASDYVIAAMTIVQIGRAHV